MSSTAREFRCQRNALRPKHLKLGSARTPKQIEVMVNATRKNQPIGRWEEPLFSSRTFIPRIAWSRLFSTSDYASEFRILTATVEEGRKIVARTVSRFMIRPWSSVDWVSRRESLAISIDRSDCSNDSCAWRIDILLSIFCASLASGTAWRSFANFLTKLSIFWALLRSTSSRVWRNLAFLTRSSSSWEDRPGRQSGFVPLTT